MPNNIWKNLYDTAKAVINPKKISEQICSGGVGAALLTKNGNIYTGVNIEMQLKNASDIEVLVDNNGTVVKLKDLMPYSYS